MTYHLTDNLLTLQIDSKIYNEAVVFKCFYWLCKDLEVDISLQKDVYIVLISGKDSALHMNWDNLIEKIKQSLIDFKLRDIVNQETRTIRELIVAKAFAHFEIEEEIHTDISDGVGFDPKTVQ